MNCWTNYPAKGCDLVISKKEIALIHVAKTKLGLDDYSYRNILKTFGGVESAKDLNVIGFKKVMDKFESLGFKTESKNKPKYKKTITATSTDASAVPTPAHLHKINSLYDELNWGTERRLGFNKRLIKKPWPQTREEANKIIEALKAMVARNRKSV